MDGSKFDDLARASAISRRGALKAVAGALATFLGVSTKVEAAPGAFQRAGKRCDNGQPCGSLAPCTNGVCTPIACEIGGAIFQGAELNPNNTCQFCIPTLDSWTDWVGVIGDGQPCTTTAGACTATTGQCLNVECMPDVFDDGTSCGDGQVCCSGQCCGLVECCGATGACEVCFSGCEIQGTRYDAGSPHPTIDCLYCNPEANPGDWTPVADDTACGGVAGRFCCNGSCCSPTECCSDAGACMDCFDGCLIDNIPIDPFTGHPTIDCLWCDPDVNENDWSPVPEQSICGGVAGRVCCNSECCSPTECCNGVACEECGPHCRIDNADISAGTAHPTEACLVCDPDQDIADWSNADNETSCGSNNQVCCNGGCCGPGQCCDDALGCGTCYCTIGVLRVPNLNTNADNRCQICDYHRDPDDWSTYVEAENCGDNNDRECCLGACCPRGECCVEGACASCPCEIGDSTYDPGEFNDTNACQYCDPERDRFTWTALDDNEHCDGSDSLVCCGGLCCQPGECCDDGTCRLCDCDIDGEPVPAGTFNEPNSCQVCQPASNRFDWSPVDDDTPCGPGGEERCCDGICCDPGECCLLGACGECLCSIVNQNVAKGVFNQANDCEVCDPDRDPFAWSELLDGEACGTHPDQVCCNVFCCPIGECCAEGACEECGCVIEGRPVAADDVNLDNSCQSCKPDISRSDWITASDGSFCGPGGEQTCCTGRCCPVGQCCLPGGVCGTCICAIGEDEFFAGRINPENECEVCDPTVNPDGWTALRDESFCGLAGNEECCGGNCCPPGNCCQDGSCQPCGCDIVGRPFEAGAPNPDNPCEVCTPDVNRFDWSPASPDTFCGPAGEYTCCLGDCCPDFQCCVSGQSCGPCICKIGDEEVFADRINPDNECEFCDPTANPDGWTPLRDGSFCDANSDEVCCSGRCCAAGECCVSGSCRECGCDIGGLPFEPDAVNPENSCQSCKPETSRSEWTTADDESFCGPTGEQTCCSGRCCPIGECCFPDGACAPCICTIGPEEIFAGRINPGNECEFCDPTENPDGWTRLDDGSFCGPNGNEECCGGNCCPPGNCCIEGACQDCGCEIGGLPFDAGTPNPDNPCEVCTPTMDRFDWSPSSPDASCGPSGDQRCCLGNCCPEGECCLSGAACGPCICTIGSEEIFAGRINPGNECEFCDPTTDHEAWTPLDDDSFCGPAGLQVCCGGICCPEGNCCSEGGVCELCQCEIENVLYDEGAINPANSCELCETSFFTDAWSPQPDNSLCGDSTNLFCCTGRCCGDGECCNIDNGLCETCKPGCIIDGVHYDDFERNPAEFCEVCNKDFPTVWSPRINGDCPPPCLIDGVLHRYGTINPANRCEECRGRSSWSPSTEIFCGAGQDQNCCNGVCCPGGECCTEDRVCGTENCDPEGCSIGGGRFPDGTDNPDNQCLTCDVSLSKTSWTAVNFSRSCGPNDDQFCCNGVCCPAGMCCNGQLACDFEICELCGIGGNVYHTSDRNPANPCEHCIPDLSHTSWSIVPPNFYCDQPNQQGACCNGVCCPTGMGCRTSDFSCQSLS